MLQFFKVFFFPTGLIVDIVAIAVIKSLVRRKRPSGNQDDMLGQLGPDKYSFPSGHASRSVFVTIFFLHLVPVPIIFWPSILAWCVAVCFSRILLERHHILDVLGGVALGWIISCIVCMMWVSDDTAHWYMSFLTDETGSGGDYHV